MSGEVLDHKKASQWTDEGTYKQPKDADNIRVPRLEVDDATTYIDKDVSDNMTFTDAVTGTKKLSELGGGTDDQTASEVEVEELGTATYDDVQDYINFFGDRTILSGGTITDNGNGTAAIASLTGWCKETDSDTAVGRFFNWASPGNTAALTDLTTNYVYIDYNGGTLQLVVSTSRRGTRILSASFGCL